MSLVIVFVMFSCFDPPPGDELTGNLEFRMLTWNTYEGLEKTSIDTYTCPIVDIRHLIKSIQLTQDTIYNGGPVDQQWLTFYESDNEMLHSERDMTGTLDIGTYKGIKINQRNLMYWICTHPDDLADTLDFPSLNYADTSVIGLNDTLVNIFGVDGPYYVDEDTMKLAINGGNERMGCHFTIFPGKTTRVTVRMNLVSLDWIDKNMDGQYTFMDTSLDRLDNWLTPADSIVTMADFIVEYFDTMP